MALDMHNAPGYTILHGEFFFYKLCAGLCGGVSYNHALCWLSFSRSFPYMVYAGFFMWRISSLQNKRAKIWN